jgi:hypothetical protein
MKKILFPALATLLMAASPAAFAQGGPWYVVQNANTHECFAAHRVGYGDEEATLSGPLASQSAAISAIQGIAACGGAYGGAM